MASSNDWRYDILPKHFFLLLFIVSVPSRVSSQTQLRGLISIALHSGSCKRLRVERLIVTVKPIPSIFVPVFRLVLLYSWELLQDVHDLIHLDMITSFWWGVLMQRCLQQSFFLLLLYFCYPSQRLFTLSAFMSWTKSFSVFKGCFPCHRHWLKVIGSLTDSKARSNPTKHAGW